MQKRERRSADGTDASMRSHGAADTLSKRQIESLISDRISTLRAKRGGLPLDIDQFAAQQISQGFGMAAKYEYSSTSLYFGSGIGAAHRPTVRRLVGHLNPRTVVTDGSGDLAVLTCARWTMAGVGHLLAWRYYFFVDQARTLLPSALDFFPQRPIDIAEAFERDVGNEDQSATAAWPTRWREVASEGGKPPLKMNSTPR